MENFTKFCVVRVELFHTDGQTDMTKLIVVCRKFAKAPETWLLGMGSGLSARPTCRLVIILTELQL